MIPPSRFIHWQRQVGYLAMVLLAAALLSLADALVGGLKGSKGLIELIPGDSFAISGPMPPRTETIRDFVIDGEPADESVRLIPKAVFSGFWFGGAMWRGSIEVSLEARGGLHVVRVKDPYGEKQNPALVFSIQVWPSVAERNTHSPSFLTRSTGHSPFAFAALFAAMGLAAGGANFLLGHLWARRLAAHRCGEIYKLRHTEQGTEVTCELPADAAIQAGTRCTIFRPSGEAICLAQVLTLANSKVVLLADPPGQVRFGDVVCLPPIDSGEQVISVT